MSKMERNQNSQVEFDLSVRDAVKMFGNFSAVDGVSFDVESGRFFSILGPSGCGKTTLLRMIAGFIEPTRGKIAIRGLDMAGIPPNRRPVNLIFQHLALFPMMNVEENIAFGLKRRGGARAEIRKKVTAILERLGLPGFEKKGINQLSGGQKQRVAIARCLVLEPAVLLLDEPLGALDLKLREQMKVELKNLQTQVGTTFVYITHDQSEALVMSDHVAVMNNGVFEQVDTPQNLYYRPRTPFVAGFVGESNVWHANVDSRSGSTLEISTAEGLAFRVPASEDVQAGSRVKFFLRPEAVVIEPDGNVSGFNRMEVSVKSILFDGANSRLLASGTRRDEAELMIALPQTRRYDHIRPGDRIEVGWDEAAGVCFPSKEK
jgi:spermidine/putrescine transport system ATP-binding protein